jgi:T4 bacteriophage base plate protein
MALPKIELPIYSVKLPSTEKEIKIRPFTVKEEKLLLMALQSKDTQEIINTVKQVINNCIIEPTVNVDKLPFFDMDYLFIALRAKSVGETLNLRFRCKNIVDGKECDTPMGIQANISNIVIDNLDYNKDVELSKDLIIRMKYPTYSVMKNINDSDTPMETKIKYIMASVDKIIEKDSVHDVNEYTKQELQDFIESLTHEQYAKLEEFVDNYPSFSVLLEKKCPKCGFQHRMRYTDFSDFFQ